MSTQTWIQEEGTGDMTCTLSSSEIKDVKYWNKYYRHNIMDK